MHRFDLAPDRCFWIFVAPDNGVRQMQVAVTAPDVEPESRNWSTTGWLQVSENESCFTQEPGHTEPSPRVLHMRATSGQGRALVRIVSAPLR